MAYGIKPFRRIQISNVEGTPFTAEAATEILFGEITIHSSDAIYHTPDQDRGTLAKIVELPFMTAKDVELEFTGSLYDRLMIFICSNSIRGNVTPSNGGGSVPLQETWVFEPGLTTLNTPDIANGIDTFTVEFGDNVQEGEMAGMVTTKWEIEGEVGAEEDAIVTVTWNFFGKEIVESTFTAALTDPIGRYFPSNIAKFYMDAAYADIGDTQKTGVLKAFKYTFETMFTKRWAADGTYYFSGINEGKKAPELELTYWRESTFYAAELAKFRATPKTIFFPRLELISNVEIDSGQANYPKIQLDGAFIYTEWPELDEEGGTSFVTVKAMGVQDPTSSKMMTVTVVTAMDAFA
jgi:hypothetical protein